MLARNVGQKKKCGTTKDYEIRPCAWGCEVQKVKSNGTKKKTKFYPGYNL